MSYIRVVFLVVILNVGAFSFGQTESFHEKASGLIKKSLQKSSDIYLKDLYNSIYHIPIWVNKNNISYLARELFQEIKRDNTVSKTSNLYSSLIKIENLSKNLYLNNDISLNKKISLEFKISKLYNFYAKHHIYGEINWNLFQIKLANIKDSKGIDGKWITHKPKISPISLLHKIINQGELHKTFEDTKPKNFGYKLLEKKLAKYREYQKTGKWRKLPSFGSLKIGTTSNAIPQLRERFKFMGDYGECRNLYSKISDSCIKNALIRFQKRYGLAVTGFVNKRTQQLLNESIEKKIQRIILNLNRIKWLNPNIYDKQVIINIPSFELNFISNGKSIQNMRVVVGNRKHPTPIFSNHVKTIVLNPYWNVPASILEKEFLPHLKKNTNYLKKQNMKLYSGWETQDIEASSVDWQQYQNGDKVPYRVAQLPGKGNALGKIKFLFPNQFAVYMHDTPSKSLFKRRVRAFSHGCIRLQKPRALLKTFSKFNSTVNYDNTINILKGINKKEIYLNKSVPVDIIYLTSWVDNKGILNFRNDIYGYDRMQQF